MKTIDLRTAQLHFLLLWAIGAIPLVAWLFLTISECSTCFWTPLSYATPPISMMVLVFFNRDSSQRKVSKDLYRVSLGLSILYLATISSALLYCTLLSDPLDTDNSIMTQFGKFDQLLTFILGLTMAGLGVIFSKNQVEE